MRLCTQVAIKDKSASCLTFYRQNEVIRDVIEVSVHPARVHARVVAVDLLDLQHPVLYLVLVIVVVIVVVFLISSYARKIMSTMRNDILIFTFNFFFFSVFA